MSSKNDSLEAFYVRTKFICWHSKVIFLIYVCLTHIIMKSTPTREVVNHAKRALIIRYLVFDEQCALWRMREVSSGPLYH